MRRIRRPELGTFSVSAIDLFASALGAFIVLTLVLFPYFPNLDNLRPLIERLRAEIADLETALGEQQEINDQLADENDRLQGQIDAQQRQIGGLQGQLQAAQADAAAARADADAAAARARNAAFIGIEPVHPRYQLVIDISGSIVDFVPNVIALSERVVDRLEQGDEVRVVMYSGPVGNPRLLVWPGGAGFRSIASDADKAAAMAFIAQGLRQAGGLTPTFDALHDAVRLPQPSNVFLITDGLPQVRPGSAYANSAETMAEVRRLTAANAGRHQISVVGIGEFADDRLSVADAPTAHFLGFVAHFNGGVVVASQR